MKLELGGCCAFGELASTKDVAVVLNLGNSALLVARAGSSWDIRHINTSIGVIAIYDTFVECVSVRCASGYCEDVSWFQS